MSKIKAPKVDSGVFFSGGDGDDTGEKERGIAAQLLQDSPNKSADQQRATGFSQTSSLMRPNFGDSEAFSAFSRQRRPEDTGMSQIPIDRDERQGLVRRSFQ